MTRTLWAVSDLHAAVKANTKAIDSIRPTNPGDWLIVAGDVAERTEKVSQGVDQTAQTICLRDLGTGQPRVV